MLLKVQTFIYFLFRYVGFKFSAKKKFFFKIIFKIFWMEFYVEY